MDVIDTSKLWTSIIVAAFVLFFLMLGLVFANGQTFGQRCEKVAEAHSEAWRECVENLSKN